MNFRIFCVTVLLLFLSACLTYIIWHEELQYRLPTPVPANYTYLMTSQKVESNILRQYKSNPLYLHFYNPDCPCSHFNAKHVREISRMHGDSILAWIVVPYESDIKLAKKEFGNALQIISDSTEQIAKAYGIYSTQQAVIIDTNGNLFYRGTQETS